MGGTRKQAELSLLAKVDEQTIRRSIQHLRDLQAAEQGVTTAAGRQEIAIGEVSEATQRNINAVRQNITVARQDNLNRQRAIKDLDQEARARREVAQSADKQATSTARAARQSGMGGRTAGGSDGTDFGRVGRGVSSVAAVLPGGAGNAARSIADFLGILDDVPQAVAQVSPALASLTGGIGGLAAAGAAGIALAALALVIKNFADEIIEAQRGLEDANARLVRYYQLIETGTAEQIKAELDAKELEVAAYNKVNDKIDQAVSGMGAFEKAIIVLLGVFGTGPAATYKDNAEKASALTAEIEMLNAAYSDDAVQARSATQATKEQTTETQTATRAEEQRTAAVEKATAAINEQRQQLAIFYENLTARARESAQQAAQAERDLVMDRQRIYADYAERIKDQDRQDARERAREARRAEHDRRRAEIEGRDEAFEASISQDFAALARIRRDETRNAALERLDQEFEANEKLISQRERDEDNQLSLQRQLAQLTERAAQTRQQQLGNELDNMRQQVQEWLRLRGIMVDANRLTEEQIRKWYQIAVAMGSVPQTQFGARLGSQQVGGATTAPASTGFGAPFGGRAPAFGTGGGAAGYQNTSNYAPTINATYNITGPDPRSIQRQIEQANNELVRRLTN